MEYVGINVHKVYYPPQVPPRTWPEWAQSWLCVRES